MLGKPITNTEKYAFQYQGRENDGHRHIFINAFCKYPENATLHKDMIQVLDGGDCYFTIKFDEKTRIFYELIINGEA